MSWSLTVTNEDFDLVLPNLRDALDAKTAVSTGPEFGLQARAVLAAAQALFGKGEVSVEVDGATVTVSGDAADPVAPPAPPEVVPSPSPVEQAAVVVPDPASVEPAADPVLVVTVPEVTPEELP